MNVLALNAGSATLKYRLFRMPPAGEEEEALAGGVAEHAAGDAMLRAAEQVIGECRAFRIDAVGHRVVHGGARFLEATLISPTVVEELQGLRELDPLHNPTEVALIEAGLRLLPGVPAAAVFDTAFHRTLPEVAARYALPDEL